MVLSSSSYMHHSHRLAGCHATGINSLLISFLLALCCLYLLHQATSFTWIIVSSSKLSSSGQILLRSIVARPISSLKSVTLSELTKTMSPLETQHYQDSEYLFRDKATRNKFNNSRPASTSLSHASWVLYLSSQYFNIRCSLKKSFFTHLCLIAIRTYPIAWG